MNSPTITMERSEAVKRLEQYEAAAAKNPRHTTDTDRRIAEGYKVLAKGGRLVDVNEALKAGGLNLAGIPRLAIARAHVEAARWSGNHDGSGLFWWHKMSRWDGRAERSPGQWRVAAGTFDGAKVQTTREFRALTPLVPLPHRPKHKLDNYFLLWEASWHAIPRDPYLLRPITGALMEIVAEWDLTDLEVAAVRAGSAGRRSG